MTEIVPSTGFYDFAAKYGEGGSAHVVPADLPERVTEAALRMAVARPERMTAAVRAGLLAPYDTWEHRVAIDRFVHDIPASPLHPTWQTLAQIERSLPQLADWPCLLIWGMRDWCFRPDCLERLQRSLPAAEVHRLADASHYVVEDAHEEIVPILERFLARDPRGDGTPAGGHPLEARGDDP